MRRPSFDFPSAEAAPLSLGGVSLRPFLLAFALVEIVAALVPRWRHLRISGVEGRVRLGRAVATVGIALALVEGLSTGRWLVEASGPESGLEVRVVAEPDMATYLLIGLSLTAVMSVLALIAGWVTRNGVMNGWGALLLAYAAFDAFDVFGPMVRGEYDTAVAPATVALVFGAHGAAIAAAMLLTRTQPTQRVRNPVGGISAAFLTVTAILWLPWVYWWWDVDVPETGHFVALLVLPLSVGLAVLWNQPSKVAEVRARATPNSSASAEATAVRMQLPQALFVAVAVNAGLTFLPFLYSMFVLPATLCTTAMATALVLDLTDEIRARRETPDLVSVWPMHRTYAVGPAVTALGGAGIPAFARGQRFRALSPFLESYLPIEIFVPAKDLERARALLAALLAPRAGVGEQTASEVPPAAIGGLAP